MVEHFHPCTLDCLGGVRDGAVKCFIGLVINNDNELIPAIVRGFALCGSATLTVG